MQRYNSHERLTTHWTNDNLFDGSRCGRITEPLIITTETGRQVIPATLNYIQDNQGDRHSQILGLRFRKEVREYGKGEEYSAIPSLDHYILYGEKAGVKILAMEALPNTPTYSGVTAFDQLTHENSPLGEAIANISQFFHDYKLGLLGSSVLQVQNPDTSSDIDLFIQGGKGFTRVTEGLREPSVQQLLSITPISDDSQNIYAKDYARRFKTTFEEGKRLALLRHRYILKLSNGKLTKISFSGAFSPDEYSGQTLLGTKRQEKARLEGRVVHTQFASAYPRVHTVEIDGEETEIISLQWVLQLLAQPNDQVVVEGIVREKDGKRIISLEDPTDKILLNPHR